MRRASNQQRQRSQQHRAGRQENVNETKKRGWLREGENGFTLIELLIAIVVAVGVLAAHH